MPIYVGDITMDIDMAQAYQVQRSQANFALGGMQSILTTLAQYGTVSVATEKELNQVPEADRVSGAMVFWSTEPIYLTHGDGVPGLSDVLIFQGQNFRVFKVWPYDPIGGYYKAMAARMVGN